MSEIVSDLDPSFESTTDQTPDVDELDWIKPSDARQTLMAKGHEPQDVEKMFFLYLRNGDLRAKAAAIWKSDERFTTAAWKNQPEEVSSGPIPVAYWRKEKAIEEDRSQCRIPANQFLATVRLRPRRRIMMRGVRFYLPDLKRLQPQVFGETSAKPRRGRPPELDKRDVAWRAVLTVICDHLDAPINSLRGITGLSGDAKDLIDDADHSPGKVGGNQINEVASMAYDVLKKRGRVIEN